MRFKRVYIEITNTCNLSCSFCIRNDRVPRTLSIEEFRYILKEVRPFTDYLYLHVLGEPLSHPDLGRILESIEEMEFKVNITTNGTLLKAKASILGRYAIRQINVSLHSFPQHQRDSYFEDVFSVCECLAKQGIYINYRLWNLQENAISFETKDILNMIRARYQVDVAPCDITRLQRIVLCKQISLHFEEVFTWPSLAQPFVGETGRCLGMKDMCAILSDGTVVPCCLDSKGECELGNILVQPFHKIIDSNRALDILHGFARHKVKSDLCQRCSYRLRFSK